MTAKLLIRKELEKLIDENHEPVKVVQKKKPQILVKFGNIFIRSSSTVYNNSLYHVMNVVFLLISYCFHVIDLMDVITKR